MEVYDSSSVSVKNGEYKSLSNLANNANQIEDLTFEDTEISTTKNTIGLEANGFSFSLENIPDNDTNVNIDFKISELNAQFYAHEWHYLWFKYTSYKVELNKYEYQNFMNWYRQFSFNDIDVRFSIYIADEGKYLEDVFVKVTQGLIATADMWHTQLGRDKEEYSYSSAANPKDYKNFVFWLYLPGHYRDNTPIIIRDLNVRNVVIARQLGAVYKKLKSSMNEENNLLSLKFYNDVEINSKGDIVSKDLQLSSSLGNIKLNEDGVGLKLLNQDIISVSPSFVEEQKSAIKFNEEYIPTMNDGSVLRVKNGVVCKSQPTKALVELKNNQINIIRSSGIQSIKLENNLLKIKLESSQELYNPKVEVVKNNVNQNLQFNLVTNIVSKTNEVHFSVQSNLDCLIYVKIK